MVFLLLCANAPAGAHAELDRTEPRPDSTVTGAPHEIAVWFTQKLEAALSSITVRNAAGQRVEAGKARVTGNVMRVPLKAIGAGTYLVNWRVLSVDTHRTQGSFRFHVRE
jgi:methionine-rich copper-binding protein CopC